MADDIVRLVDEHDEDVAVGEIGEALVRTTSRAQYWKSPADDARKFVAGEDGSVTYRTGDRVRRDEHGYLHYLGRTDRLVKIRGNQVEPGHVELSLREMPGIHEVAVTGTAASDGTTRLVAYMVPQSWPGLRDEEMRAFAADRLAAYAIPSRFIVVRVLPRTARGKLDWDALPEPEFGGVVSASADDTTPDDLEAQIIEVWKTELELAAVGLHEDFFDLGGTSIDALSMFSSLTDTIGHDLAPTILLHASTVHDLAAVIRSGAGARTQESLVPIRPLGSRTPLICVHGGGGGIFFVRNMVEHFDPERPVYALQAAGFAGKPPPYRPVEEMASRYVDELRIVQPHGPYALTGLSFGA